MKIVFADERIREYKNGDFHAINDGEPIEAPPMLVTELLAATHPLEGEEVGVFVPAKEQDDAPLATGKGEFPEGFPHAKVLEKLGFSYEEVLAMTREQLIDLKGIGDKGADAILEFGQEK
jgi:hypothetical protein